MTNLITSAIAMLIGIVLGFGVAVAFVGVAYARKWYNVISAVETLSDDDDVEIVVRKREVK